jgi:GH25 family lysozyme M1 (1,4-beta-N-acetylmuramidase)
MTARLVGVALAGLLTAGAVAVVASPPAHATPRPGATGLHDRMMPTDAPDAATSGAAQPNTLGGTPLAALPGAQTGIDVARYQHPNGAAINWTQVAASGQSFVMVKATELYTDTDTGRPVLYTNAYLPGDINAAHAAGLVVGAYAFAHPENSPFDQADALASAIGTLPPGSLPPVLDLEVNGGLNPTQLQVWTQNFLNRLQADTNTVPMIYAGPSFWGSSMGGSTAFTNYPLWEAHYTTAASPYAMGGWSGYTLWQFTDAASIPGISAAVDQDRSNGTPLTSIAQHVQPPALNAPGVMTSGQTLVSNNQQYIFAMQSDGNLVEYGNGRALWQAGTSGNPNASFAAQPDGNLVVYASDGRPLWASGSGGGANGQLVVQDDGRVVMVVGGRAVWNNGGPGTDLLSPGTFLKGGQTLHDASGTKVAAMQSDGNFVIYRSGVARWQSGTSKYPGARLILQSDGNLVIYDNAGIARWSSVTSGTGGGNVLAMQGDGNLVLYKGSRALWARGL